MDWICSFCDSLNESENTECSICSSWLCACGNYNSFEDNACFSCGKEHFNQNTHKKEELRISLEDIKSSIKHPNLIPFDRSKLVPLPIFIKLKK